MLSLSATVCIGIVAQEDKSNAQSVLRMIDVFIIYWFLLEYETPICSSKILEVLSALL